MKKLNTSYLRSILEYVPISGVFIWKYRANIKPCDNARLVGKIAGGKTDKGYIGIKIDNCLYLAHRLAWQMMEGYWPEKQIDHINGIRNDNSWKNLREATHFENQRNVRKRKTNKSGYKGVCWDARAGKWRAAIRISGKQVHIGHFLNPQEAHMAYIVKAQEHFGNYSCAG